ncbi:tRNA-splicing endonuclease subunit sen34 [Cyclospora cayetanensis]|uniref:tRNA-intron lyase n=1 Tax=Cyclospora cayetanensis TaxID=88456 RepID=A0A1D3CUN4_9EIME|nr:tRNA-splicing endonuclease subunit sen34 [Cyclospora cayetanensis]
MEESAASSPKHRLEPESPWCSGISSKSLAWRQQARTKVLEDLTRKGFLMKEGASFGADFLGYAADPRDAHASFLVFVHPMRSRSKGVSCSECSLCSSNKRRRLSPPCNSPLGCHDVEPDKNSDVKTISCSLCSSTNVGPSFSLISMQRIANSTKKAAIVALVTCSTNPPVYIQLDRVKASPMYSS